MTLVSDACGPLAVILNNSPISFLHVKWRPNKLTASTVLRSPKQQGDIPQQQTVGT